MRCIPEEPEFGEGQLAEKAVWTALKASLPDDAVLAHSVQLRDGRNEYEIDLLVLWPGLGMAAIEVKGGQVSIAEGQWYQSDRNQKRKIQSPVAQSQSSLHALKNWLENQLGSRVSSRCVYMVSLPYTDVRSDWTMAGCPRALILDQTENKSPAELVRRAIENEGGGAAPLAPAFLERIVRQLSGNLDPDVGTSHNPQEDEDAQDLLTERQSVLLQATRSLPRIRFAGGAGSGKTWLAVEKARLLSRQGKRVGLFCYNKGLGQYLQDRVSTWRQAKPVFTGEFHEYVRGLGVPDGSGQDYFDVEMPRMLKELAAKMEPHERLDAVIVDEAQDFAPLWWDALLACTKDPDGGEVYAFMDDRQDVYRRWGGATADLAFGPTATFVPIHIDDNLRNTRKIAETLKPFAGEHFTPRGSTGLPVRVVDCPTDQALGVADDCVDALIAEGWANNQIALLTTKDRHPIHLDFYERNATEDYWREFHAGDAEFYGHVLGFKGLERSVVVLCVNGFKDMERAAEQLYVGLSRARSLLVVVGDSKLLEEAGGRELKAALSRTQVWKPAPQAP
ncbi:NERD domain-containing protein [Pseudarthrobacter sp. MDT3-26]|uniref:nuclease-related domain-containing DEAD/DEAH box helicase n=1 Tax=Pseudarthrobacter raffinosi TaxID=2953651 RepID=UPI00208DE808|nr:NERD domain-containing protein [Pseudarthrobacter sp. MDT3-26]MCO4261496.1 NERD domain-containing protein [Pseudarthrobacter sp. MDT3-26]